jgi:hypothetical protein
LEAEVLRLSDSVERASEHPLAVAIVAAAEKQGIATVPVTEFDSPTGKGAVGVVDDHKVVLGNAAFLNEHGIDVSALAEQADKLRVDGATTLFAGGTGSWMMPKPASQRAALNHVSLFGPQLSCGACWTQRYRRGRRHGGRRDRCG